MEESKGEHKVKGKGKLGKGWWWSQKGKGLQIMNE